MHDSNIPHFIFVLRSRQMAKGMGYIDNIVLEILIKDLDFVRNVVVDESREELLPDASIVKDILRGDFGWR
jgi:hypothetical protein